MPRVESDIQTDIRMYLTGLGAYVYNAGGSASSAKGTADLLVCYRGRFLALELKRGEGSYGETRQQAIRRSQVAKAGGVSTVVTSIPEVAAVLRHIDEEITCKC
jgi:hypothetical protein